MSARSVVVCTLFGLALACNRYRPPDLSKGGLELVFTPEYAQGTGSNEKAAILEQVR